MKANRLEAFSDGVIAIIITIMVLDLKVPHDPTPAGLLAVLPVFLCYGFSFLIVAIYWVNHHHLIHLAHKVDGHTLWANLNLLFWLSLFPWVTRYLGENLALRLPALLYAAVATACSIGFYLLRRSIARHHRHDADLMALHGRMARKNQIATVSYLGSMAAAFIWVPAALALVALPAAMYFMPDRRVEACEA
jgi:uncharacterized membrane protein